MAHREYRFHFAANNMWQINRVKQGLVELGYGEIRIENWTGCYESPAVYLYCDVLTTSKEHYEKVEADMSAIAFKASPKVLVENWPLSWQGWDYIPPQNPEESRIKVKTLEIKTAAGSLIARIEIGQEVKVQVDRTVFGASEDEALIVLGDGEPLEGCELPLSKWA